MDRIQLLSFVVVAGSAGVLLAGTAQSQSGVPKNQVVLQPTTPGTSQSGHSNITGTSRAGQFVGGGAGLTDINADLLDGIDSTQFLQNVPNPLSLTGSTLGGVISGFNSNTTSGAAGLSGNSTAATGVTYGVRATSTSSSGRAVYGEASSTTGSNFGGWFESDSSSGRGVFGSATATTGTTYGVYGQIQSQTGRAVYGSAFAPSGANYAGYFDNNSTDGTGLFATSAGIVALYGEATKTTGVTYGGLFTSVSSTGIGMYAQATGVGLTAYGGKFSSNGGAAVYAEAASGEGVVGRSTDSTGGHFVSFSTSGTGLFGNADAGSGNTIGVRGDSRSPDGRAIVGNQFSTTGVTYGGWFNSDSSSGYGVYGRTDGEYGVFGETLATTDTNYGGRFESPSSSGRGVYGLGSITTAGTVPYGVRGQASTTTDGYGVYAVGDMGASGVKPFRIDHPADPENKYLLHYSSESPFPQNFYNGNVVTDNSGYAWVELPEYFGEINTNIKYQLTVVDNSDNFVMAKVTDEVKDNRFRIRTSKPNIKVSWEVKADRNDARIQWKRPTDVMEKVGGERGKYQHPEYYHQPESMGMDYRPATKKEVNQAGKSGLRLSPRPTRR